jgi:hypothetical protein
MIINEGGLNKESPHYQDMFTPNANFGKQVYMTYGSPTIWNEFGDNIQQSFQDYGYSVDRDKLFPSDVHLTSSADRGFTDGKPEMNWLNDNSGMNDWRLGKDDIIRAWGKEVPSEDLYWGEGVPLGESLLAITQEGANATRPNPNFSGQGYMSVPSHEYGHYIDNYLSGGNKSLSDVTLSLDSVSHHKPSQEQLYSRWMNDPKTEHLNIEGTNNPREVFGNLYTTALANPWDPNINMPKPWHMRENIARAFGPMFNPQYKWEGHGPQITNQREDVLGALANYLNQ